MRKEVEASIRMIKHSFVEGTFVRLNINTGEEIPLTADMCLEPIIKDLKILEMLRPHLINAGIGMFDNVEDNEILHLKLTFSGKEYKQLEEWLKNE